MNWCPGTARFPALPLVYRALLISALLFGVVAPSPSEAQGSYGVGGYLVRPEQDVDNDPSGIDPNATDSTPEILRRKRQRQNQHQNQIQPESQPQQQNQSQIEQERAKRKPQSQERPAQHNLRERARERAAEEAERARKARARERAEEARQNRKTRSGHARDAAPETSPQNGVAASGRDAPPPRQDAGAAIPATSPGSGNAENSNAPEVAATPHQIAAPAQDDSKAATEKAAKTAELMQDGARAIAEDAASAQVGALNAGETTVAAQNANEAVAQAAGRAKGGKDAVKDAALIFGATYRVTHSLAAQQTAEKAGAELALRQPPPAVAHGEGDTAKAAPSEAPAASPQAPNQSAETEKVAALSAPDAANNAASSVSPSAQSQPQAAEKAALLTAPENNTSMPGAASTPPQPSHTEAAKSATTAQEQPAMATDPLDTMIGQMLMVGFEGTTPDDPPVRKLAAQIASGQVGTVLFLNRNIVSPQQVKTLNAYLRDANPQLPVLLAIDQEGGIVQRLPHDKGFPEFPSAGQLGQANDPLNAYAVYERMAAELASYGFNLNLGPVVDLGRGESTVIAGQERSFGAQPRHVAAFAKAFCVAHRTAGVLTALKHFPGHGSASGDTHDGRVDVSETWRHDELEPYRELLGAGATDIVMTGHITHREWSGDTGLPASVSEHAVKMLRADLSFNGVIVTDDLEMGAVSKQFSPEEAAVRAIKAGNDIIMLSNKAHPSPDLPERIAAAIREAVRKGDLTREQIARSYERVIALKQKLRTLNAKLTAKHEGAAGTDTPPQ